MNLILNTFGTTLSCNGTSFVVANNATSQTIPVQSISSIYVMKGTQLTSDAVMLAIENEVEILFIAKGGTPVGRVWSPKYGSVSTIRKGQLVFSYSTDAFGWIKGVLTEKISNQQALLLSLAAPDDGTADRVARAVKRLTALRRNIEELQALTVADAAPQLRGFEGAASKVYFEVLNLFLPPALRFAQRSQHPAYDVVNAMLNYGYGVLYARIEAALIKAGIDPYVGVMHRDEYNRPVLVYDVIELYRVWVDYVVYSIASQNVITPQMYSINDQGACWLENLGRRILIQSMNDYLEEVITINGVSRSRVNQIGIYAQGLAQKFQQSASV